MSEARRTDRGKATSALPPISLPGRDEVRSTEPPSLQPRAVRHNRRSHAGAEAASLSAGAVRRRKATRRRAVATSITILLATIPLTLGVALAGCTRGSTSSRPPIHLNPNMDDQPKAKAQSESRFFADGKTERDPVPGTVARGELFADAALHTGKTPAGDPVAHGPTPVDAALLTRGAQRYAIYCQPCHAENGSGQSMLRERAGVATADLTQARLVQAPDGYIFDVITHGFGLMPSYAYQVPVADRWAIIAHVRELQAAAAKAGATAGGAAGSAAPAPAGTGAGEGEAP